MASAPPNQVSDPIKSDGFPLDRLVPELRLKIFYLCLPIQGSTTDAPPLLLALAGEKKLYAEAKPFYKQSNALVTVSTEAQFKQMTMAAMLKLTGIKLMFKDNEYLTLRANRCLLVNNFQTIVVDKSLMKPGPFNWEWSLAYTLMNASGGVTKLVARVPGQDVKSRTQDRARDIVIEVNNQKLKAVGKLERVSYMGCEEIWFWEREDRKSFVTPINLL